MKLGRSIAVAIVAIFAQIETGVARADRPDAVWSEGSARSVGHPARQMLHSFPGRYGQRCSPRIDRNGPHANLRTAPGPSPVSLDGKVAANIPVWKTIALGTYGTSDALRGALNAGCRVGDLAAEILERPAFSISKARTRIALVVLSAADLGFDGKKGASRAAIYKRATQLGLKLCPTEAAPQLRLQYPDQPPGEFLHIAMDPVATHRHRAAAFLVGNGGAGLLLIGSDARPEKIVPPTVRFVFVRSP